MNGRHIFYWFTCHGHRYIIGYSNIVFCFRSLFSYNFILFLACCDQSSPFYSNPGLNFFGLSTTWSTHPSCGLLVLSPSISILVFFSPLNVVSFCADTQCFYHLTYTNSSKLDFLVSKDECLLIHIYAWLVCIQKSWTLLLIIDHIHCFCILRISIVFTTKFNFI